LAADTERVRAGVRRSPVAAYLGAFVFLGMALSVAGPALPHLRERAGVGIGASGFVLAGQSLGYILGSLAAGRRYDNGHGHRLLLGAGLVAVAAVTALTSTSELWMVVVVFAVIGFSSAAVDVGGNTLIVWSQPADRVGSTLNALHLCFGIGALSTPLIVAASLGWTDHLTLVAAVMAISLISVAMLLRNTDQPVRRAATHHDQIDTPVSHPAFVLLCVFFFLYVGAEVTFAGWVSTYADEIHLGGKYGPRILASVFWAGFAFGRVVAIWLTRRMMLSAMLIGSCSMAVVATFVLAIGDGSEAIVWAATGVIGFTLGPQYATMLAFGDDRLRLSASSTSLIIASSGVGGLLLPIGTGWILDRGGASLLPWAVGVACVATTAVVIAVIVVGAQRPPLTSRNAPVT
jgi:fucose permease